MPAKSQKPPEVLFPKFVDGHLIGFFPQAPIGDGVDPRRGNGAAMDSLKKSPAFPGAGEEEEEADPFAPSFDLLGEVRGPGAHDGTEASGEADAEDGLTGALTGKSASAGGRLGSQGATGAFGRRKQSNGREVTTGGWGGWGKGGWHGGVGQQSVEKVDAEGKMTDGSKMAIGANQDGVNLSHQTAKGGKTSGVDVSLTEDAVGARIKSGTPKTEGKAATESSFGVNVADDAIGIEGAHTVGGVGVSGGLTAHDGISGARDEDAVLNEFLGGSSFGVTRKSGYSAKGGIEGKAGPAGAGFDAHVEDTSTVGFHKREADLNGLEDQPMNPAGQQFADQYDDRLLGVGGLADVDLDRLGVGEAFSFGHQTGQGAEASASLYGVSASLGYSERGNERTVLSRSDEDTIRVSMSAAEGAATTIGGGAFDAFEVGANLTSGNSASVGFTAKGEAGKAAVLDFQATGLLPGVENIAEDLDPELWEAFQELRKAYRAIAGKVAGTAMEGLALQIRSKLYAAAAPLNRAFLESKDRKLSDTDVEGVEYDDHTRSSTYGENTAVSLLGFEVMDAGFKETEWDKQYKESGAEHTEAGYEREDDSWLAPDEKSRITTDPKGYGHHEEPPELVMFSEWVTWQGSRDAMAALGPDAFDLPKEAIEAWREGEMGEGAVDRLAVVLTQKQLDRLAEIVDTDGEEDVGEMASEATRELGYGDNLVLGQLYEEAALEGATQRGLFRMQGSDAMMDEMMVRFSKVTSVEDFLGLTPKERSAIVITSAVRAAQTASNPWEGMKLALRIPDEKERNQLIRRLYATIERSKDGANAPIQFVHWVQGAAKEAGVDPNEILGATKVSSMDKGLEGKETAFETVEKGGRFSAALAARELARVTEPTTQTVGGIEWKQDAPGYEDVADLRMSDAQRRADKPADTLLAMRRKGGPKMIEMMIEEGLKDDPRFLEKIRERVAGDKPRAAIVEHALRGTKY